VYVGGVVGDVVGGQLVVCSGQELSDPYELSGCSCHELSGCSCHELSDPYELSDPPECSCHEPPEPPEPPGHELSGWPACSEGWELP
jgi:hypothetical protein